MGNKINDTLKELLKHSPYTFGGAAIGLLCMVLFNKIFPDSGHGLFKVFHPGHIILSAWATTLLFKSKTFRASIWKVFLAGYIGSIGIATLSDSVIPFMGEEVMGISVPVHGHSENHNHNHQGSEHNDHNHSKTEAEHNHSGQHDHSAHAEHNHESKGVHIGFIEEPILVNGSALLGIILGFVSHSASKMPHFVHVLISVWASTAHIMMNTAKELTLLNYGGILIVLFAAVLVPCCLSDIIFPTLAAKYTGKDPSEFNHHHH
ncbi:hypothetical protein L21SP3_00298 [Sedimentisphaera cyanobacteriorum]|uniref:Uncharacterized protein n=1 Tax=Sedimentisphaera cyanobacteriorum TaxID=1940790 RepID=A0A1Q2HML4_9BACT|nr:hypothetical protein [Sedimentisphaera cyanobacteriorum]AQQ08515.1 hypothetical protein L21SP3_00298 [Sedimentisphaera cyanobacteriorum]